MEVEREMNEVQLSYVIRNPIIVRYILGIGCNNLLDLKFWFRISHLK